MQNILKTFYSITLIAVAATGIVSCSDTETASETSAPINQAELQSRLEAHQDTRPEIPGFSISIIIGDGTPLSAATGHADPDGRRTTPDTPVRIASITKTFVAATILRLWEDGLIDLDTPIRGLISETHDQLLTSDRYDTTVITVRNLLMHAGGLNDHTHGGEYESIAINDPSRVWTRTGQIRMMVDNSDPVGAPGEKFSYSDTGYILLGEIIETITGETLGAAVRRLTKFDEIGLENVWWDGEDVAPSAGMRRAHQWFGEFDTHPIHGSIDAFAGGGVIASVEETARFFDALFGGKIYKNPETLLIMTEAPGHPGESPYRIGLFEMKIAGFQAFGHSGFWRTDAFAIPERQMTVAGVALNADGLDSLRAFETDLVEAALAKL